MSLAPFLAPTITAVVNDASFTAGGPISTGSWVAIFGTGLAPAGDSRKWNEATGIVNGKLPVNLDGTSVTVNGKPATVEFIQPSQVNIQPPDDTALGAGLVQINVHVPSSIGNGDAGVVASVGGVSTQTTANMIPIHN